MLEGSLRASVTREVNFSLGSYDHLFCLIGYGRSTTSGLRVLCLAITMRLWCAVWECIILSESQVLVRPVTTSHPNSFLATIDQQPNTSQYLDFTFSIKLTAHILSIIQEISKSPSPGRFVKSEILR